MKEFEGFEEILMAVIENTAHAKNYSNEKRMDMAMKALFGKNYKLFDPQLPAGLEEYDIRKILKQTKEGKSMEGEIKQALKNQFKTVNAKDRGEKAARKAGDERLLKAKVEAVKKHIKRNKMYYAWTEPSAFDFLTSEEKEKIQTKRDALFKALRNAGWPI